MYTLLIKNCTQLLTVANVKKGSSLGIIPDAYLACKDEKIVALGSMKNLDYKKISRKTHVIDAKNKVVMPGLIDCHTHLVFAGDRSQEFQQRLEGKSYLEILKSGGGIFSTVQAVRQTSKKELLRLALERLQSYLEQGVTTVEIKTGYGLNLKNELKMIEVIEECAKRQPIRIVPTFLGAHAIPLVIPTKRVEPPYPSRNYLQFLMHDVLPKIKNRVKFVDIFCEKGAFRLEESRRYLEYAKSLGFGIKIHADQLTRTGASVMAAKLGVTSIDHGDCLTNQDMKALAKEKSVVVITPLSALFLQQKKIASGRALIDAGIPVALATNFNPGSSPNHNIFLAMALSCLLMGLRVEEAIRAVTIHAACALLLSSETGSLEIGKQADVLITKTQDYRQIIYGMGEKKVEKVIVKGKVVL